MTDTDASREVIGDGKVAVVTGSGSGIGRALAEAFAAEGSAVIVADLDIAAAEVVASGIRDRGGDALAVAVDVSDAASVDALAAATIARFGRVDVLCNNAGVSTFNLMRDQTLDDWRWVLGVNLWGVVHGMQTFIPIMREQGTPAHIVSTSSLAGLVSGIAFIGPYNATKVAVVSISETLRQELAIDAPHIGISVLIPSSVNTKVLDSERNRPAEFGEEHRTDTAEFVRQMIRDTFTSSTGKTPEDVATIVVDGIRAGKFWIITHPEQDGAITKRLAEITANIPAAPA